MNRRAPAAFTLIELLVVIGIIAILAAIGIAVGVGVTQSGRAQATMNTVQVLETVLADLDAAGHSPRDYKIFPATNSSGEVHELPVLDGREDSTGVTRDDKPFHSLGRFLAAAKQLDTEVESRWAALDSELIRTVQIGDAGGEEVRGAELMDQWDNPIRAVVPAYDGGFGEYWDGSGLASRDPLDVAFDSGGTSDSVELRRSYRPFDPTAGGDNVGDADEGICPGGRPYFYSAGPDGDPGTREDNVYGSVRPQWPAETADFE